MTLRVQKNDLHYGSHSSSMCFLRGNPFVHAQWVRKSLHTTFTVTNYMSGSRSIEVEKSETIQNSKVTGRILYSVAPKVARAASPRGGPVYSHVLPCRGLQAVVNSGLQCTYWYHTLCKSEAIPRCMSHRTQQAKTLHKSSPLSTD